MKTFWVIWTYLGNSSDKPIEIDVTSAEDAADKIGRWYSKDFRRKASIYVFDRAPAVAVRPHPMRAERSRICDAIRAIEPGGVAMIEGVAVSRGAIVADREPYAVNGAMGLSVPDAADLVLDAAIERADKV